LGVRSWVLGVTAASLSNPPDNKKHGWREKQSSLSHLHQQVAGHALGGREADLFYEDAVAGIGMEKVEDWLVLQEHDPRRALLIGGFKEFQGFFFAVISK
jgi:hypothetical protein